MSTSSDTPSCSRKSSASKVSFLEPIPEISDPAIEEPLPHVSQNPTSETPQTILSSLPDYLSWNGNKIRRILQFLEEPSLQKKRSEKDKLCTRELRNGLLAAAKQVSDGSFVLQDLESRMGVIQGIKKLLRERDVELNKVMIDEDVHVNLARRFALLGKREPTFERPKIVTFLAAKFTREQLLSITDPEAKNHKTLVNIMRRGCNLFHRR
jgi:hypothetical protein